MTVWILPEARGETVTVQVNGQPVAAQEGETVATVLLREGYRAFGRHPGDGGPAGTDLHDGRLLWLPVPHRPGAPAARPALPRCARGWWWKPIPR